MQADQSPVVEPVGVSTTQNKDISRRGVTDPYGDKLDGDVPGVSAAVAITNAVYHAIRRRMRDLPIRVGDVTGRRSDG